MQRSLCFDTTSATTSVALLIDGKTVKAEKAQINYQAEDLLGLIDSVLKSSSCSLKDINHVVVGAGPGSFTGIRTGIATARGIGAARNLRQYGIALPLAYAIKHASAGAFVAPFLKANKSEVFTAIYYKPLAEEVVPWPANPDDTSMVTSSPLIEVSQIIVVAREQLKVEVDERVSSFLANADLSSAATSVDYLSIEDRKEQDNSACVIGEAMQAIVEISGEFGSSDGSNCKALDRFSLNKANPLYVKGVNAPTLAERQASQGS